MRRFCAIFALAGALYLLLIDTTSSPELYAGLGATLLAAVVGEAARRHGLTGGAVRPTWILRSWRVIRAVPADIFWVSLAALSQLVSPRAPRGELRAVPFRFGDPDDGADVARRALAEALGSLTPNTIVLGVDEEHDLILVHQLRRSGGGRESVDILRLG